MQNMTGSLMLYGDEVEDSVDCICRREVVQELKEMTIEKALRSDVLNRGEIHPQGKILGFHGVNCVHGKFSGAGRQL